MGYEFDDMSGKVISAAINVHRQLGPGFLESVYEQALKLELAKQGLAFESQKQVQVFYDGEVVGTHILDLLVENQVLVELKAVKALEDIHYAQLRSYLRATKIKVGLLLNFSSPKVLIKRVVN